MTSKLTNEEIRRLEEQHEYLTNIANQTKAIAASVATKIDSLRQELLEPDLFTYMLKNNLEDKLDQAVLWANTPQPHADASISHFGISTSVGTCHLAASVTKSNSNLTYKGEHLHFTFTAPSIYKFNSSTKLAYFSDIDTGSILNLLDNYGTVIEDWGGGEFLSVALLVDIHPSLHLLNDNYKAFSTKNHHLTQKPEGWF